MSDPAHHAIFMSYARDDAAAARRIAEALRGAGLEVWFDENELTGGDAWDQKIRTQIADCALFVPLISANTQSRLEGYFRLEWRLAEQRSHLMAKGKRFLVPVCIDDTRERGAQVPEAFLDVQWTRVPGGAATAQFVEVVKRLMGGSRVAQASTPAVRADAGGTPALLPEVGRRVPAAAWIGAMAVIGIGATFFATRKTDSPPAAVANAGAATRPPTSEKAAPKTADKFVAVLPFENQSGDRDNEYFSDGISDELLTQLGKVPGLSVKGRNSSFAFKGKNEAETAIGQKLGATYVVNGSVRAIGTQVRIQARLVNVADGVQLWSQGFTEELKDIFALRERIAGLIAQNLQLKLGGAPGAAKTVNPEAVRLVLEGRYHWNLRTDEAFTRAEAAFMKALEIAPDFAEAHAGLAGVCVIRANYSELDAYRDRTADTKRARDGAERALQLDSSLAEAHAVLGFAFMLDRKFAQSEQSFQRALALNPNSAVARCWHALLLWCTGRLDLSVAEYRRAAELDPLWFINLTTAANALFNAHHLAEALEVIDRALSLRPDIYIPAQGIRARILLDVGRKSDAVKVARLIRQRSDVFPRWGVDGFAVFVLRQAGLEQEAADYAAQLLAQLPADSYVRGFVFAALSRFDEALAFLERTPTTMLATIHSDPMWDAWRDDARFHQLIAKLGITEEYKIGRETLARMQREQAGKGGQKSEVGGQKSEVGGQRSEAPGGKK